mgnify:FL=1
MSSLPDIPEAMQRQLKTLGAELDRRRSLSASLAGYDEGGSAIPAAVIRARLTNAYRLLMGMANAPWGSLVVDSVLDRLEVSGIRTGDKALDDAAWSMWQDNGFDSESKLAHRAALLDGRAFALIWPDGDSESPVISVDDMTQMVVSYAEGSRRIRTAAMRRWVDDDDQTHATLYRPDGIFKFQAGSTAAGGETKWEAREVAGETWPLENPYKVVPVVEYAVNRKLKPGQFPFARGEFEHCTGLLDRINLLTFLGLVVALWQGFPLRGVIGESIKYDAVTDDDGNVAQVPQAPFDAQADHLFQLENPEAKLAEYKAADRANLAVYPELDQLAVITKTPRHYFPLAQGMTNISADAIRASEGGLHAKVASHKSSLGESHEEMLRVAGLMRKNEVVIPSSAETQWKDSESRSLAERADAASKLKDILPPAALMEMVLNATPSQIARWEAQGGIATLLAGVAKP